MLAISDIRRVCYFVGGLRGSQGDSLASRTRSWHASMFEEDLGARPLSAQEFILGDAGFALTAFLVRTDSIVGRIREESGAAGGRGRWTSCSGSCPLEMGRHSGWCTGILTKAKLFFSLPCWKDFFLRFFFLACLFPCFQFRLLLLGR